MPLRVLTIEDDADFRLLIQQHIVTHWPDASVVEHDPATAAPLPENFNGADYDVVLLDYQLGKVNGLDLLQRFSRQSGFPPVIMLTGQGGERLAVHAIKAGAADYISKSEMTHENLVRAIQEAVDTRGAPARYAKDQAANWLTQEYKIKLPDFRLVKVVGEGAMSTVFLAERRSSGEPVVIKLTKQTLETMRGDDALARFVQEYEVISRVNHPNVVRIYELGFSEKHAYIAMEYFPAGSLRDRSRGGTVPVPQALQYVEQIARGLAVMHAAGIVHRDLKPANIMLREDNTPVIIDFGVAKDIQNPMDLTQANIVMGTPLYMSPEQGEGQKTDGRSDLYSLGIIFFELLTGSVPFSARTTQGVVYKHRYAPVPALPPEMSSLQPLVETFLAKSPDYRFRDADEAIASLNQFRR